MKVRLLLAAWLPGLLWACGPLALSEPEAELPPREELESYLRTAHQLSAKQKSAMERRRPFEGMTVAEADLAMRRISLESVLRGGTIRGVYLGAEGSRYYLTFQGEPPRLIDWSYFTGDEVELTDPRDLRPDFP